MDKSKFERIGKAIAENPEILDGLSDLEKMIASKLWLTTTEELRSENNDIKNKGLQAGTSLATQNLPETPSNNSV